MERTSRRRVARLSLWFVVAVIAMDPAARASDDAAVDPIPAKLEAIRIRAKLPGLGGAIVTTEGLSKAWVAGVRAAGHPEKVELDDPWHVGSCTKAMTATLVALLVERGDLAWDESVPELLPDLSKTGGIDAGYRDVTLVELLCHRAGVPDQAGLQRDGLWSRCWERNGTPTDQRRMLTETVLAWGPAHEPGTKYVYSNAGVAIAGHIAETAAKRPYEALMEELLFKPLGMKSAGFGPPGSAKSVDAPRGHDGSGTPVEPGPRADNPPAIAPGGTAHMSLADWAKFVSLHLKTARGDVKVGKITLRAETMKKVHTPFPGKDPRYAMGWGITRHDRAGGDGTVWTHNGSNTMWYCVCTLAPEAGFAVLAATNQAGATGQQAAEELASLLIEHHATRAP